MRVLSQSPEPLPPSRTDRSDAEARWVEATRSGDNEAFGRLMERYKDPLVNYLIRMTGDRDRAEDLAQEAFVRFYERIDGYRDRGQLAAYLYRIAYNLLVTQERRKKRWRAIRERFFRPDLATPDGANDPRQELIRKEIHEHLDSALARLPTHQRSALVLFDLQGCSYREIAEVLGCTEGTVKSRIHRGRSALRELLAPYWRDATRALPGETM